MDSKTTGFIPVARKYQSAFTIWLLWTIFCTWTLTMIGLPFRTALLDSFLANTFLAGACLIMLTILRFYLPGRAQYLNLVALVLAITFLWYSVFRLSWMAISPEGSYNGFWEPYYLVRLIIGFLVITCFTLYSVLIRIQEEKEIQLRRKADAEKLARDAELFRLQQQLQPHFLFNSLNSISALAGSQPAQARSMIQQLSTFLRGTLRKNEEGMVKLAEELQQLTLYLDIEKIRFGHRLRTIVQAEADCQQAQLPPLILQPLLENAIKYGLYDTVGDVAIRVEAQCADQYLRITVSNPYDPETAPAVKGAGFGLASVQRRLFLLFGRNDLLQTHTQDQQFITTLRIPQP